MTIIHTTQDEATKIPTKAAKPPWALPSPFDFSTILKIINNNSASTDKNFNKSISSVQDDSNWSWNWKPIEFNTPQVKCPKALNTLLGRRFSVCNPSGICPAPCISPSQGCTCHFDNKIKSNDVVHDPEAPPATTASEQKSFVENKDGDNVVNNISPDLEDGELEEGQLSEEGQLYEEMVPDDVEEENKTEEEDQGFKSQGYGYGYVPVQCNSFNFPNEVPFQNVPETKKDNPKAKRNQRRRRQRQRKAAETSKQSVGTKKEGKKKENEKKKREEEDLIGKLKYLKCADKKPSQEACKEEGQNQDKPNAIENHESTLASFFEGEIGLWTTETVDDVLRDTNAEKDANKKAKRGPLTAERKLKKKIQKKKKKVQKDKQLGIKRLKLAPVTKPKQVILCRYYMKGRCAQGKQCPFSHDGVPITKSEICKYYVNNSCLKGDECPFSHDLSTFPCKFYHTKGHCLDGDSCRFSHKPITEKDMVKVLNQNELGNQETHEQESTQATVQNIVVSGLQKSDAHCPFSVGDREQSISSSEHSKSALESNQQMSLVIRATSPVLNYGRSNSDEHLETAIVKDLHISCQNGTTSFVSSISSFPAYNMYGYQLRDDGENDALLAAREAAFSALAPVADHEANLISLGLVRVPTFISSAYPAADRDNITEREHKEALEESRSEHLMGGNENIPRMGFLNSSKSAIKILEDILNGNANSDKHADSEYVSSIPMQ